MSIAGNLRKVRSQLPEGVKLLAVSKFHPVESLREAYEAGQRLFGESRVQEMVEKQLRLPADIEWHFIGHLQTNKIKYLIPFVSLIHGIDTYRLLAEVNKQAERAGRVVSCLLQLHVAREETKFGFTPGECRAMLQEGQWRLLSHVRIAGVMAMASNVDDLQQVRDEFREVSEFFQEIKHSFFADDPSFCERSMGMSHDFPQAVEQGSTMVRVGTLIFGER